MSARRLALAVTLLAGCTAPLKSTLPPPGLPPSRVGIPALALSGERTAAEVARLETELAKQVGASVWTVPVQLLRDAEGLLRIRLGAEESFEPDSAQLRPTALALYAELGDVIYGAPAFVTHVLVHADTAGPVEPALDLTARRATSVQEYWIRRGLPATRLRTEGRGAREPLYTQPETAAGNRRVEIVLKPVIAGREPEAWIPPAPVPPCDVCGDP